MAKKHPLRTIICRKTGKEYRNYIKVREGTKNGLNNFELYSRYIMEQHTGRKLKSEEIVHHKNENKMDDRIGNLEIMTRSEHTHCHRKGKKPDAGIRRAADYFRQRRKRLMPLVVKLSKDNSMRKVSKKLKISRMIVKKILEEYKNEIKRETVLEV